jgi:hypothetical protein
MLWFAQLNSCELEIYAHLIDHWLVLKAVVPVAVRGMFW